MPLVSTKSWELQSASDESSARLRRQRTVVLQNLSLPERELTLLAPCRLEPPLSSFCQEHEHDFSAFKRRTLRQPRRERDAHLFPGCSFQRMFHGHRCLRDPPIRPDGGDPAIHDEAGTADQLLVGQPPKPDVCLRAPQLVFVPPHHHARGLLGRAQQPCPKRGDGEKGDQSPPHHRSPHKWSSGGTCCTHSRLHDDCCRRDSRTEG